MGVREYGVCEKYFRVFVMGENAMCISQTEEVITPMTSVQYANAT